MTRGRAWMRGIAAAAGLALLLGISTSADARRGAPDASVARWPTDFGNDEESLRFALQGNGSDTAPVTIVFEKGDYSFGRPIFVFKRTNVTICGATGNPRDVTITVAGENLAGDVVAGSPAFLLSQVENIAFQDLTIRCTAPVGAGISLQAVQSTSFSGFVDGVDIDDCVIEASRPIIATAEARNLTVQRSKIEVGGTDRDGILWGDGAGLFVARNTFTAKAGVSALSAVSVLGAGVALSDGERPRGLFISRNRIRGDFALGIILRDPIEVRVRRNRIKFTGDAVRPATSGTGGATFLRTGIAIQRQAASSVPTDYEVRRNRVRGAGYGAYVLNSDQGVVARNDFRGCGSQVTDQSFGTFGGALYLILFSPICRLEIENNDFRNLASPTTTTDGSQVVDVPAITVVSAADPAACADVGDGGNKVSKGRVLFLGADQ